MHVVNHRLRVQYVFLYHICAYVGVLFQAIGYGGSLSPICGRGICAKSFFRGKTVALSKPYL